MKKTSVRKLMLKRESLRRLDDDELGGVAGGGSFFCSEMCSKGSRCVCNVSETWCGRECPTWQTCPI